MPTTPRPPLPVRHANPQVQATLNSGTLPPVKYQILNCQGQDILVGRLKIETPTPTGHAFILRRFDTNAVSLTTMFRAAFPNAPDHEEKSELQWVKENYDLTGNNGGPQSPHITRLAGTWVSPALARTLGDTYALGDLICAVVEASPDPNGNYRRSGKANVTAIKTSPGVTEVPPPVSSTAPSGTPQPASKTLPTPSPQAAPNPAKRRKESSPAPPPAQSVSPPSSPSKLPLPRRASRTRSPAPKTLPLTSIKTPKSISKSMRWEEIKIVTPSSDLTIVDEENVVVEDGVTGSELHQEDVAEQKALIENLKAERANKEAVTKEIEKDEEEEEEPPAQGLTKLKRAREEGLETLKFDFKEPEVGERVIATNNRVARFHPRTKQLAWGAAVFALGMGAVAFLPNLL